MVLTHPVADRGGSTMDMGSVTHHFTAYTSVRPSLATLTYPDVCVHTEHVNKTQLGSRKKRVPSLSASTSCPHQSAGVRPVLSSEAALPSFPTAPDTALPTQTVQRSFTAATALNSPVLWALSVPTFLLLPQSGMFSPPPQPKSLPSKCGPLQTLP